MKIINLIHLLVLVFVVSCGSDQKTKSAVQVISEKMEVPYTKDELIISEKIQNCSNKWSGNGLDVENKGIQLGILLFECFDNKKLDVVNARLILNSFEKNAKGESVNFNETARNILKRRE